MSEIINIDSASLSNLSPALKNEGERIEKMVDGEQINQTFGYVEEQQISAVGLSWHNPLHPYAEYIRIYINQTNSRYSEIGSSLLDRINSCADRSKVTHLQYPLVSTEHKMTELLKTNGFSLFRRTYEPTLEINKLKNRYKGSDSHPRTMLLKEVMNNRTLTEELFELMMTVYDEGHTDNPRKQRTIAEEQEVYFSYPIDKTASLVGYSEDGKIDSYIIVFEPQGQTVEMGWAGASNKRETLALKQLFSSVCDLLQKRGINYIEPEIDSTDYYLYHILFSHLDYEKIESWDAYKRNLH